LCPLCKDALDELLDLHTCPGCTTAYHRVCNEELGGCSTIGCSSQGRALSRNAPNRFRVPASRLERIRAQLAAERDAHSRRREREAHRSEKKSSDVPLALLILLFTCFAFYFIASGGLERVAATPVGMVLIGVAWIVSVMSRVTGFFSDY
jgi:hypothetical protein